MGVCSVLHAVLVIFQADIPKQRALPPSTGRSRTGLFHALTVCFRYSLVYFCVISAFWFYFITFLMADHYPWIIPWLKIESVSPGNRKHGKRLFFPSSEPRAPSLCWSCQSCRGGLSLAALDVALFPFPSGDTHASPHPELGAPVTLCPKDGRTGDSAWVQSLESWEGRSWPSWGRACPRRENASGCLGPSVPWMASPTRAPRRHMPQNQQGLPRAQSTTVIGFGVG